MNKYLTPLLVLAALYVGWGQFNGIHDVVGRSAEDNGLVAAAFRDQSSGVQVSGEGVVDRVLSDDVDGSRHQRFILRLASGQTLLVAHNIDLAPRISSLERQGRCSSLDASRSERTPPGGLAEAQWTNVPIGNRRAQGARSGREDA
jgi:hypothetical protein